jgi:hypothetical protein
MFTLPKPIMTYEQWVSNKAVLIEEGTLAETCDYSECKYAIYVVKRDGQSLRLGIEFATDSGGPSTEYVRDRVGCNFDPQSSTAWGCTGETEILSIGNCRYYEREFSSTAEILTLVKQMKGNCAKLRNVDLQEYLASCVS